MSPSDATTTGTVISPDAVSKVWYQGSSSSHDSLTRSSEGFLGPGVYLGEEPVAHYYGGPDGYLRTVKIEEDLRLVRIREQYSEDARRDLRRSSEEDLFGLLECDAILLTGRSLGDEMILRAPSLGEVTREQRLRD